MTLEQAIRKVRTTAAAEGVDHKTTNAAVDAVLAHAIRKQFGLPA